LGPSPTLTAWFDKVTEGVASLKASGGSDRSALVVALEAALIAARTTVDTSSPAPLVSNGVLSPSAASIDAVTREWLKVTYAFKEICLAS
jgi:hypothetical protein